MAGEVLPWWAYSRTPMPQQCELCSGVHETSQCSYYKEVGPYVMYEEQPYFQYHPQQYQQDVPNLSYFSGSEEFQHQQPTLTFQSDEAMEEIRKLAKSNEESFKSMETLVAQVVRALEKETQQSIPEAIPENNDEVDDMEELRRMAKSNEESIKSLETLVVQVVCALEEENQQIILEAIPENNGAFEQDTACIIEEDKFQGDVSNHKPAEEFDHAREVDALERALFGTDAVELHKFQELVCSYQEADDRGKDVDLLFVSKYKDGGSALEPMEEVRFEEPKASAIYTYPPPLHSHEARNCVLFYTLTDFGSTDEGIGKGRSCYANRPSEKKGQKVCCRDDDEVSRRDDQANYYHP